jgi:ABC-type transport system involved in multi-copper enzyme maturation permease subunit
MSISTPTLLVGALLIAIQLLAAVPWLALALLSPDELTLLRRNPLAPRFLKYLGIGVVIALAGGLLINLAIQDKAALEVWGQVFAVAFQLQLLADFFIFVFLLLLQVWPKGGAVALAAFREGIRQPMFWLITLGAFVLLGVSAVIPYFTFGEDHLMIKDIGYDTIMLAAALFGTLMAGLSVSEEIEGRTAVTLMSKPVSRRQFLLGKFVGIVLAALVMYGLLGTQFEGVMLAHRFIDRYTFMDAPRPTPGWVSALLEQWKLPGQANDLLRGVGLWVGHTLDTLPGLILSFSQVMVLVAIGVSLATRLPMVVNLVTILVLFVLARLSPTLLDHARNLQLHDPGSTVTQLLAFVAQVLDTLLPDLDSFRIDPTLLGQTPPPALPFTKYIASVSLYGLLYTGIALLFGLILFEDRDLA